MCNDELLKRQLKYKRKAKYEMDNFCEQYGLPPVAPSRKKGKKHDKSHKNYNHKKIKNTKTTLLTVVKVNYSHKQRSGKGKYVNCGKPGYFSKDCKQKLGKLKNKFNTLNIDDKDQEELFRILELNNASDSLEFLLYLILAINLLLIVLIRLILKLVVEIPIVMLLNLLILSLRVKRMRN